MTSGQFSLHSRCARYFVPRLKTLHAWRTRICSIVRRNLTPTEWRQYVGQESNRTTCLTSDTS
jgi:hypothetical protein